MNRFDLFFGRFQPVHNGHLHILKTMTNPTVVIVKGKKASRDKGKNPFDFDYQKYLIERVKPGVRVLETEHGYLPDIIKMIGECPAHVFCGSDRIKQYQAQMERANKGLDVPCIVEFVETSRLTSASVVREAIRSGDKDAFKANVPKEIWDQYPTMRKRIQQ